MMKKCRNNCHQYMYKVEREKGTSVDDKKKKRSKKKKSPKKSPQFAQMDTKNSKLKVKNQAVPSPNERNSCQFCIYHESPEEVDK